MRVFRLPYPTFYIFSMENGTALRIYLKLNTSWTNSEIEEIVQRYVNYEADN